MPEMRVGKKIQKWDEVTGMSVEVTDTAAENAEAGRANPIRSMEDQIEQNDNMIDGIVNNLPEETVAEKEERTSVIGKLKAVPQQDEKRPKKLLPELVL